MRLAVPGQIISLSNDSAPFLRTGHIDFSGVTREISLTYLPDAEANDHAFVHAGFAIAMLDAEEAQDSLQTAMGISRGTALTER